MSNFKVVPISKRYDFSDHDDNDDEVDSVASSSIHSTYEVKLSCSRLNQYYVFDAFIKRQ